MINIIDGFIGSGKTLIMVIMALLEKDINKMDIYSNFDVEFMNEKINPYDLLKKDFSGCAVLLDEIETLLDCRTSQSYANRMLSYFFYQSRKNELEIYGTAQQFGSIENRVRYLTFNQTFCKTRFNYHNVPEKDIKADDFSFYNIKINGQIGSIDMYYKDAVPYFDLYDTKEIIVPFIQDYSRIDFDDIKDLFLRCKTKKSFCIVVKHRYPNLVNDDISACFDFIKYDELKLAKEVIFKNAMVLS